MEYIPIGGRTNNDTILSVKNLIICGIDIWDERTWLYESGGLQGDRSMARKANNGITIFTRLLLLKSLFI